MSEGLLEGIRILTLIVLIVLVWFGLVRWKLVPLFGPQKSLAVEPNLGDH